MKMGNTILVILKLLMILISLGWVSLWLLKPTQFWTRKWRGAEEIAATTVFDYNGLDFAVYTFPVLAVAILGFIYLELKPEGFPIRRKGRNSIKALSNPLVINSYLGILSMLELMAILLFLFFLAWTFYTRISNDFRRMIPVRSVNLSMWQYRFSRVATRCGLLAEACLALLLLPILRGLSVFRLLGIQFEASKRYHVWLGTSMIFFATLHGAGTLFVWGVKHQIQEEMWQWQKTGRIYLAGEITLLTGLVIWFTSLPQIRRKKFELFYYTHHLYIIFFVFFLFHAGDRHFYMVLPGIFLFGLDKLLRIVQSGPRTYINSARVFPCKVIELILPKTPELIYSPTSVIFLKVPSISKLQWHSFTLSSSSRVDEHNMSVLIRCEGEWTNSLYNLIQAKAGSDDSHFDSIPVSIEGPYGPASLDFLRHESLLLIAGGIGVTPFLSILQEVGQAQSSTRRGIPRNIQLVYIVKKSQYVCLLDLVLSLLQNQTEETFHLKLKLFVTQEQSGGNFQELINEFSGGELINFNQPSSSYPTQGPERLLWVAAIVGLSSILFLILLCFFNRAVLHSIGQTSRQKNPSSLPDLFILCSLIIALICGTLMGILPRRKRLKKDIPQGFYKTNKETKPSSLETSSVLKGHEVHYGNRPNFHDILSQFSNEAGGSDIGVLVCGPESMKEHVASLCRMCSVGMGAKRTRPYSFHALNFTL